MKQKILLVDDENEVLMAYQRNLFKIYHVHLASSGGEALNILNEEGPFAVIMTDYNMPGMNGVELLSQVKQKFPDTTRIIITGFADINIAINSVNTGKVFRFLTKPISTENLLLIMRAAVEQYLLIISEKELLDKTLKGSIKILIDLLTVLQPEVFSLSNQYRELSKQIAENLGLKNIWEVEIAALLSQIGAIILPTDILNKFTGKIKLNDDEVKIIRKVPSYSKDFLKHIPRLEDIANSIQYQDCDYSKKVTENHEPQGKDIPVIARILKIVKDYFQLLDYTNDKNVTYNMLLTNHLKYDPEILKSIEVVIFRSDARKRKKAVYLSELQPNMVLAESIINNSGTVLVAQGRELTKIIIMKLQLISNNMSVTEPIFIFSE